MTSRLRRPIFTIVHESSEDFRFDGTSTLIVGDSIDERSGIWRAWATSCERLIVMGDADDIFSAIVRDANGGSRRISLRQSSFSGDLGLVDKEAETILDLTSLPHHIWAPLVRFLWMNGNRFRVIYVEPGDYAYHSKPTAESLFDLSDRFLGIKPLPGFVDLSADSDQNPIVIPMIGFEGARFIRILDDLDPRPDRVFPIVGVPGFRPNYPFLALEGNRIPLEKTEGWVRMHYARANCPFSAFYCIDEIRGRESAGPVVLAPIGTKPHALGAILYCIASGRCSIAYDHPVRKVQRTLGTSRVCEYHVSAFRDTLKADQ